jgi:hypothetical protein
LGEQTPEKLGWYSTNDSVSLKLLKLTYYKFIINITYSLYLFNPNETWTLGKKLEKREVVPGTSVNAKSPSS